MQKHVDPIAKEIKEIIMQIEMFHEMMEKEAQRNVRERSDL